MMEHECTQYSIIPLFGLGSNIGRGLFVGWVEHPDIFCWVSFLYPTYLPAIFVLSAKPNKMAEDRIIPHCSNCERSKLSSIVIGRGLNGHEQFDQAFQQSTDLGSSLLSKPLMLFQRAVQEEYAG